MVRQLASIVLAASAAAATAQSAPIYTPQYVPAQYNTQYAPPAPSPVNEWLKVAELPPGTPIVVHQRGYNWPVQCSLVWINPKALACDTVASNVPSQRLVIQANSVDNIHALSYAPPQQAYNPPQQAPAPIYVQPPVAAYAPPPPPPFSLYVAPQREHHAGAIITFGVVAGALVGGLIGKGFSTAGGFTGAALGGIAGGGIGIAVVEANEHSQPTYPGYRYQHP